MCKIEGHHLAFPTKRSNIAAIRYRIVRKLKCGLSAAKKNIYRALVNPVVNGAKASYAFGQFSNNPTTETIVLNCIFKAGKRKNDNV